MGGGVIMVANATGVEKAKFYPQNIIFVTDRFSGSK
jgi:hypothetical protein